MHSCRRPQNLLNLIRSHLFSFVFISISLGGRVIEDLAVIYVKECSACFPLRVLVSGLTFMSLIHSEVCVC